MTADMQAMLKPLPVLQVGDNELADVTFTETAPGKPWSELYAQWVGGSFLRVSPEMVEFLDKAADWLPFGVERIGRTWGGCCWWVIYKLERQEPTP